MKKIEKAYEITDAKISFVSLVGKAANKREFLIVKAEDKDKAEFTTNNRIVKADEINHYVTGIVYEPMAVDTDGNFMTEETIEKAAYWFAKNGNKCDIQHSFEPLENASVVESYVAKSDFELEGYPVKKGTWLMTVEVDNDTFAKVQKGELTGFSMGGVGKYSTVDVDVPEEDAKGLIAKLAKMFNVTKGAVKDEYSRRVKYENFHTAFCVLRDSIEGYDENGNHKYETDEKKIRKALSEFNDIVVQLLAEQSITKTLTDLRPSDFVAKAGKKMSAKNLQSLKSIQSAVADLLSEVDEAEEKEADESMKAEDITSAVQKAMKPLEERLEAIEKTVTAENGDTAPDSEEDAVSEAIQKAMQPFVEKIGKIEETVGALAKARNLPANLNDESSVPVQKSEQHYMAGMY